MLRYVMRLEWLEDILAVAETGSFSEAAERRGLTQSAFSRRIRLIEERVGVELFDRARKPVALRPATAANRATMERLAGQLRALARDLRDGAETAERRITVASQHALTATRATALIEAIHRRDPALRVALVSDDLDACLARLLARRADIALLYREPGAAHPVRPDFVEVALLGRDRLIPVFGTAPEPGGGAPAAEPPHVAYPPEVFFGRILDRLHARARPDGAPRAPVAETALTLAALEMARARVGVAWVPRTLAAPLLAEGALCDLSDRLPSAPLEVTAVRLRGDTRPSAATAWDALCGAGPRRAY